MALNPEKPQTGSRSHANTNQTTAAITELNREQGWQHDLSLALWSSNEQQTEYIFVIPKSSVICF